MLKKAILASVITVCTSVAVANSAPYVGASVGVINNSMTVNNNNTFGTYRGIPFNLYAGYGSLLGQSFYLAGEVFGTAGTANISDNTALKSTYGYGAAIIPGVMLSDHTLAYARVGVLNTRFSEISSNQRGAQFGLGMQTSLTQHMDLRGEYDFAAYESKKMAGFSVAPRSDQFSVGLVYKFD